MLTCCPAEYKAALEKVQAEKGADALREAFMELAKTESDCSSAARGGDLGSFGPGQMQRPFEAAACVPSIAPAHGTANRSC